MVHLEIRNVRIYAHLKLSRMRKELPTINAYSISEHANNSSRLLHSSKSIYQQTKKKIVERRLRLLFVMNATRLERSFEPSEAFMKIMHASFKT